MIIMLKMIRTGSRIVFLEGGAATIADLDYPAAFNTKLTPEDQQVFFYFAPNIQEDRHQAFREAWGAPVPYILKAKKFAEPLFQSKKIAEKVHKSGRHFWAIWG